VRRRPEHPFPSTSYHELVTARDVKTQYEGKVKELERETARLATALPAGSVGIAAALFAYIGLAGIRKEISFLWLLFPAVLLIFSVRELLKMRRARSRLWRLKNFYSQRARFTGEEFTDPEQVYAGDLHIFGEGSLFQLLCIARTSIGREGLASYLTKPTTLDEAARRQEAVREMRARVEIREKVATLGDADFRESKWSTFEEWLDSPKLPFARPVPILAAVSAGLLAGLILTGFAEGRIGRFELPVLLLIGLHAAIGAHFRKRVNGMIEWVRPVAAETRVLREGLALMASENFQSPKLRTLADQVRDGAAAVRRLERLLGALSQRDKDLFQLPSRLLLMGTQLCMAIEQWRSQHGEALKIWLRAWSEFEALNALACYGYENPENAFPEFSSTETCFEAEALGHPLLPLDSCVLNDVSLNEHQRFYVISGSNMSGKSTLLRSIGLNTVLALAGAPVRARSLRVSGLSTFASLSVVDSLLNGKSKFLAEVDRLRLAIECERPVLFLIDEIFSGTNSRDRHIAAEAVVKTLVSRGGIGALSTHDLALTEIATAEGMNGVNVHMGSRNPADPMDFDYLLKPGVTQEANALAIARMSGVPVSYTTAPIQ
jgi:hypothetical protein